MATLLTLDDLKAEYRLSGDAGDPWGTCMAWWFAVAGEMFERGLNVPDDWHYRPGAGGGRDPDSSEGEICLEASDEALEAFGGVLCRLYGILKAKGLDY